MMRLISWTSLETTVGGADAPSGNASLLLGRITVLASCFINRVVVHFDLFRILGTVYATVLTKSIITVSEMSTALSLTTSELAPSR